MKRSRSTHARARAATLLFWLSVFGVGRATPLHAEALTSISATVSGLPQVLLPVSSVSKSGLTYMARFVVSSPGEANVVAEGDVGGSFRILSRGGSVSVLRSYLAASLAFNQVELRSRPPPSAIDITLQDQSEQIIAYCGGVAADASGSIVTPSMCQVPASIVIVTPVGLQTQQAGDVPLSLPRTGDGGTTDSD
jgi:hypothetical protein